MSPTYLYCITQPIAAGPPSETAGVDDTPVRRLADAWVSDVPSLVVRPTVDRIRAHDAVVATALDTGTTPLPARFGQTFATDAACVQALAGRGDALRVALARVDGCVEMTVLLHAETGTETDSDASMGPGRRYLERLGRLAAAGRRVDAAVAPLLRAAKTKDATVSHLIAREALTAYRARMDAVAGTLGGITVRLVGPAAPYSFGAVDEQ